MAEITGTSASQTLFGTSGDDVINGLDGNDTLAGGDGNDIYRFTGSFGADQITDTSGVDQIRFGPGYAPSDFRLYKSPFNNDLQILQINGPHAVVLDSYFQTPNRSAIESVVFEQTGTVWNFADGSVFRNVGFIGTSASETLTGTSFSDVLIGQGGNDDLRGGDGDDVYGFFGVFGRDSIRDPSGQDTIVIGAEYAEVDFRVTRNFGDLVISQVTGANSITLESYFNATNNSTIEAVVFARTGTVWNIVNGAAGVVPGFFDYNGYLSANPDVRAAGLDPYAHYVTSGWREGGTPRRASTPASISRTTRTWRRRASIRCSTT